MFDVMFRTLASSDAALPAKGMGAIPAQLAARLPASAIRVECRVGAVEGTTVWLHGGVPPRGLVRRRRDRGPGGIAALGAALGALEAGRVRLVRGAGRTRSKGG